MTYCERNQAIIMPHFRNLRCFFHRLMQEEFFQHTIPIIPRIAYGRMVHRHRLHTPTVAQEISARCRAAPVHYYRLAVLPSLARHLIPKALAPNDDIMLADEGLKKYVVCHPDFVIAYPKILRQRVLLFSDVLPSALFGYKPPCSKVA